VLTQTAPIFNANGEISQVMEMSTNITQIRQLQDHLSSLGLMLGSMSHGVKGMLTALDGGIYQLETGLRKNDSERVTRAADQIKQMADRIKKMVLEILYYAKSRELQYQKVEVAGLVATIVSTIAPLAEKNEIRLDVDVPDTLGSIEIDPNWMQSALVNFAENAVDACRYDPGKKDHRVGFRAWKQGEEMLCFSFEDNGMGMDQETREKMFTLFFTSKGSQGTGLGLFIANRVIQHHGGTIVVETKPNKGSCFEICLPRNKPEQRMINFMHTKGNHPEI
jgi:signal transduction histidine kinase